MDPGNGEKRWEPALEFRVYGITGTDEGAFAHLRLTASVSPAAVPAPSALFLGLRALTRHLRRRL